MNDFTKEELQGLVVAIHNLRLYKESKDEFYLKLHEKIGNMLDNYCEHDHVDKEKWCVVKDYDRKGGEFSIMKGKYFDMLCMYADSEQVIFFDNEHQAKIYMIGLENE